ILSSHWHLLEVDNLGVLTWLHAAMTEMGQYLPKSDVCVYIRSASNNGLKSDITASRFRAKAGCDDPS
ncbi:MAG: hypothetical protein WA838_14600, partial [Xanthobacteraceae bacterium]